MKSFPGIGVGHLFLHLLSCIGFSLVLVQVLSVLIVMVSILYGAGLLLYLLLCEGNLRQHLLCDLFLLGEVLEDLLEDLLVDHGCLWVYLLCFNCLCTLICIIVKSVIICCNCGNVGCMLGNCLWEWLCPHL